MNNKIYSILNKKHSSTVYHSVWYEVAAGLIKIGKVHTGDNISDAMTKIMTSEK